MILTFVVMVAPQLGFAKEPGLSAADKKCTVEAKQTCERERLIPREYCQKLAYDGCMQRAYEGKQKN
jgi:hypothetical protein